MLIYANAYYIMKDNIKKFLTELSELTQSKSVPCLGGVTNLPLQLGLKIKNKHISLPITEDYMEYLSSEGKQSPYGKAYGMK